jgi:hypothetical protein
MWELAVAAAAEQSLSAPDNSKEKHKTATELRHSVRLQQKITYSKGHSPSPPSFKVLSLLSISFHIPNLQALKLLVYLRKVVSL